MHPILRTLARSPNCLAVAKLVHVYEAQFTAQDVSHLRFAFSPLWEAVASLRVLQAPGRHAVHLPWAQRARAAIRTAGLDLTLPFAVVPPTSYIPDFLTPPPTTPLPEFADELAVVAATPRAQVVSDLAHMQGTNDARARFAADPERHLAELVEVLAAYWDLVVAPHWPRLRALLDADVLHRSRELALGGAHALFADLHPDVRWSGELLSVDKKYCTLITLGGRGMVLVPCAFAWPSVLVMDEEPWQPTLIYPARGVATLWEVGECAPSGLAGALGRTRADLLAALAGPAATGELATRLGVTAGAVSQHIAALRGAGLVVTHRLGRRTVHARTPLADALVAASA
jgi:DNA-binding transcriptional ArsR family regulator